MHEWAAVHIEDLTTGHFGYVNDQLSSFPEENLNFLLLGNIFITILFVYLLASSLSPNSFRKASSQPMG